MIYGSIANTKYKRTIESPHKPRSMSKVSQISKRRISSQFKLSVAYIQPITKKLLDTQWSFIKLNNLERIFSIGEHCLQYNVSLKTMEREGNRIRRESTSFGNNVQFLNKRHLFISVHSSYNENLSRDYWKTASSFFLTPLR